MDESNSGSNPPSAPLPPPAPPAGAGPYGAAASSHAGPAEQTAYAGPQGDAPPTAPQQGGPLDRFFDAVRRIGLHRSSNRFIGGVCGGLAERTGIDVTVVRVLAIILAFFGGIGVLLYGLAWLLLPEPDGRIHAQQTLHGDVHAGAIGAIIVTLSSFGSGNFVDHWRGPLGWGGGWGRGGLASLWGLAWTVIFFIGLGIVVSAVTRHRRGGATPMSPMSPMSPMPPMPPSSPAPPSAEAFAAASPASPASPPAPPASPPSPAWPAAPAAGSTRRATFGASGTLVAAGLAVVGAAITVLAMRSGSHAASTAVVAWAVALAVLAVALIAGGLAGRRSGLVGALAVIALIGASVAAVLPRMTHVEGIGDRTWAPVSSAAASGGYGLAIGDATLDLRQLDPTTLAGRTTPLHIPISVAIGQLTLRVPPDLSVRVESSVGAGTISNNFSTFAPGASDAQTSGQAVIGGTNDPGELNGVGISGTASNGTGTAGSDDPIVVIDAKMGFGEITIDEVTR